jgi:MFS family permease
MLWRGWNGSTLTAAGKIQFRCRLNGLDFMFEMNSPSAAPNQTAPIAAASARNFQQPTPVQARAMRDTIYGQCFGSLGYLSFSNGLLFLYLAKQGISSEAIMVILALPSMIGAMNIMPAGYYADRRGKKRITMPGTFLTAAGFVCIASAGFFEPVLSRVASVAGIVLYSIGQGMFNATWFALLSPIVPPGIRGSYFGRMRLTWQVVGFLFGVCSTFLLRKDSPLIIFQAILGLVACGMLVRTFFVARIPELEAPVPDERSIIEAATAIVRAPGYASFCCYVFLITLVTANAPSLFALIEKESVGFGDDSIVWMGNLYMIGAVMGFLAGGYMVDQVGTKAMFLVSHLSFGLLLCSFLARDFVPLPHLYSLGAIHFFYGAVWAASSIAISTEMLALIPPENKSLSTGLCTTLLVAGGALSSVLSAGALKLNMFQAHWNFAGSIVSAYDALLLICAVAVVILVVALGLVPSVIRKAMWMPKGE